MSFQFFQLDEAAFSIAPNPKYWFMSDRHQEALKQLLYGLDSKDNAQSSGGFVLLTGEVGTGKTTALRTMLKQLPEHCRVAHIVHPSLNSLEMLAAICDGFDLDYQPSESAKYYLDTIENFLRLEHAKEAQCILVIDEAQHLGADNLELLRLLTNIETDVQKLLRVVLIGQPELQTLLAQDNLRQLAQRITARYHLLALNQEETQAYVAFRLQVAGANRTIFSKSALKRLYKHSGGVPRLINLIAERSMLMAAEQHHKRVETKHVEGGAKFTRFDHQDSSTQRWWPWAAMGLGLSVLVIMLYPYALIAIGFDGQAKANPVLGIQNSAQVSAADIINDAPEAKPPTAIPAMPEDTLEHAIQMNWEELLDANNSKRSALQKMLRIWGYEVSLGQSRCDLVGSLSLQCMDEVASWQRLTQLNYPAIVELDVEGRSVYALLRHIRGDELELWFERQRVFVDEQWFKRYWHGQMQTLWQQPKEFDGLVKPGARGAIVFWLEQSLSQLQQRPTRPLSYFDDQLKASVTQFQIKHQLNADGIVGEQTMITLMQAIKPLQPKLIEQSI